MAVLNDLDPFAPIHAAALSPADRRLPEVEGFARAVRALLRDLADRDQAKSERARVDLNARALRSADALAAAAGRMAQAAEGVAAKLYDLALAGVSASQRVRYLASVESVAGWQALTAVEDSLLRAYAAPGQMIARLSAMTAQGGRP